MVRADQTSRGRDLRIQARRSRCRNFVRRSGCSIRLSRRIRTDRRRISAEYERLLPEHNQTQLIGTLRLSEVPTIRSWISVLVRAVEKAEPFRFSALSIRRTSGREEKAAKRVRRCSSSVRGSVIARGGWPSAGKPIAVPSSVPPVPGAGLSMECRGVGSSIRCRTNGRIVATTACAREETLAKGKSPRSSTKSVSRARATSSSSGNSDTSANRMSPGSSRSALST